MVFRCETPKVPRPLPSLPPLQGGLCVSRGPLALPGPAPFGLPGVCGAVGGFKPIHPLAGV